MGGVACGEGEGVEEGEKRREKKKGKRRKKKGRDGRSAAERDAAWKRRERHSVTLVVKCRAFRPLVDAIKRTQQPR